MKQLITSFDHLAKGAATDSIARGPWGPPRMLASASLRQDQVVHLQVLTGQAASGVPFGVNIPETEGEKVDEVQNTGETDPPRAGIQ